MIRLLWLLALAACDAPGPPAWSEQERALVASLAAPAEPPPSPGNEVADDPRAARLGHRLFFDPGLSASGTVACASCHQPARHFTDGLRFARGLAAGTRNTPTILGAPWLPFLTADGRKDSLWSQALEPLEHPAEQGAQRVEILHRIATAHRPEWEAVFGPLPPLDDGAAIDRAFVQVGKALEAYQRRLRIPATAFDRYAAALAAGDATGGGQLSPAAIRGLRLFVGEGRCVACHNGPLLTDGAFHNLGLPPGPGALQGRAHGARLLRADPFRCEACGELPFLDPALPAFVGAFRTPGLRNVSRTAPYMHAGQLLTLEEVVDFYRFRPGAPAVGRRDEILASIPPTLSTPDLVAFLHSLEAAVPDDPWWQPPAAAEAPTSVLPDPGERPPSSPHSREAKRWESSTSSAGGR
ncbi:cytochrome-c peroxidase [Vulgatibacter sp.]|uniref:cytochrome-c peroxidase n=1 Tax=Vulgatibacter sp. TaxID=1971226 RepID=UPI003569C342